MPVYKAVTQNYTPSQTIIELQDQFTAMTNLCITRAIDNNITSRNSISELVYWELSENFDTPSYYYVSAINRAAGIVKNYHKAYRKADKKRKYLLKINNRVKKIRKALRNTGRHGTKKHARSLERALKTVLKKRNMIRGGKIRKPVARKPFLTTYYGFKVEDNNLMVPAGRRKYERIPLNPYIVSGISKDNVTVRSFTINSTTLSLTIGIDIETIECDATVGIDRNINNIAAGNEVHGKLYDISDILKIKKRYRKKKLKRKDNRIGRIMANKYGRRSRNRVSQILHSTANNIVNEAVENREAIVLENIKGLKDITHRGDYKGPDYRFMFHNAFPYGKFQSIVTYKTESRGIPVVELSREETGGTSSSCTVCGSRTQAVPGRLVYCDSCDSSLDRDVNAYINIALRGRIRLKRS